MPSSCDIFFFSMKGFSEPKYGGFLNPAESGLVRAGAEEDRDTQDSVKTVTIKQRSSKDKHLKPKSPTK